MDNTQAFFNAVKFGDAATVASLLAEQPALAQRILDGATPLHFAAMQGNTEVVDVLLDNGADLEARDTEFNATPIGWANEKGHKDLVAHFSERGALVSIDRAAAYGMIDLIREYILEGTEHLNTQGGFGTPMHSAALWGYPEIVTLLLDSGADPDAESVDGRTALAIARAQVKSGGSGTPLVPDTRRREIIDGCAKVVGILTKRGIAR